MDARPPSILVLMGVSGAGKTTIGALLGERLGWPFEDADSFHPSANIAKMRAGVPLTDDDRWPWLFAIAAWIDRHRRAGSPGIVSCSALKRRYREILTADRPEVRLVHLKGEEALITARQAARIGHFMPPSLVRSQFEALEELDPEEPAFTVMVDKPPDAIVEEIVAGLRLARA